MRTLQSKALSVMLATALFAATCMISSCAFKHDDETPPTTKTTPAPIIEAAPAPLPSPSPVVAQPIPLIFSWKDSEHAGTTRSDKRLLRQLQNGVAWTWDAPLQLPAHTPDEITLHLEIPVSIDHLRGTTIEDVTLEGKKSRAEFGGTFDERFVALRRGPEFDLKASSTVPGHVVCTFSISELHAILADSEQGTLELRISVKDPGGNWIMRVSGMVMTPPSLMTSRQLTAPDFERQFGRLPDAVKSIRLTNQTEIHLLQLVQIKNNAALSIELDLPAHPMEATLSTTTEHRAYIDKGCSYDVEATQSPTAYTEDLYVVPLKDQAKDLAAIAANPTARPVLTVKLDPNEASTLAIYGAGPGVQQLLAGGHAVTEFANQNVASACYWSCDATTNYIWWARGENYGNPHYIACRACSESNLGACNSCHDGEPNDNNKGNQYCWTARWRQARQIVSVALGAKTSPVVLTFKPETSQTNLRWPGSMEPRPVQVFQPSTVQLP